MVTSAQAQQPRSVEFFIMHNAERAQMDRLCRRGMFTSECENAQRADYYIQLAGSRQRVNAGRLGVGSVDSPLYFDANPLARMMTLNECAHPTSSIRPDAMACQAARVSAGR